jgi:hypothetical protein
VTAEELLEAVFRTLMNETSARAFGVELDPLRPWLEERGRNLAAWVLVEIREAEKRAG